MAGAGQSYRTYVDGRWGQVHLRVTPGPAAAPPLLMLHQTPKSGWIWEPLFQDLSRHRTLIAPDTPGYGASDGPDAPVQLEDYAAEMAALMDRLGDHGVKPGEPFDIIGYHTGSVIAAALANAMPARVRRLVLVSLGAMTPEEARARIDAMPLEPELHADGSHLKAMWDLVDDMTDPRASLRWKQDSLTENLRSGPRFYHGYHAVFRHDFAASLRQLEQEVLLLNPQDDLWRETDRAAGLLRKGTCVEIPGAAHGLFALETARLCDLVNRHLA